MLFHSIVVAVLALSLSGYSEGYMLIIGYEENDSADRDGFIALRGNLRMC
jgi:hypothetical protein